MSFIPKQYKKTTATIRIDNERLSQIDALAAKFNISRNAFINQCIDYALEHMDTLFLETGGADS